MSIKQKKTHIREPFERRNRFWCSLDSFLLEHNKAPIGFEPMNQGFADPSIGPL